MESTKPDVPEAIAFRHKSIKRFKVGKFEFTNHVCVVQPEDVEEFEKCLAGLKYVDSCQIVQLRALRNELPLTEGRVIRGAATAGDPELKVNHAKAVAELEELKKEKQKLQLELDSMKAPANTKSPVPPTGGANKPKLKG